MRVLFVRIMGLLWAALCVASASAGPFLDPRSGPVELEDVGLYRCGYAYYGADSLPGRTHALPDGWYGWPHPDSGVGIRSEGQVFGRRATLLHCPWRGGRGYAWQEFDVAVPTSGNTHMEGWVCIGPASNGKSDGVQFRIAIDGIEVWQKLTDSAIWQPYRVDLTPWRGRTVAIRFVTDPGPAGDASFDFSLWGDRRILCEGTATHQSSKRFNSPPVQGVSRPTQTVLPSVHARGQSDVQISGKRAIFQCRTAEGVYRYEWQVSADDTSSPLGRVTLSGPAGGGPVPLSSAGELRWSSDGVRVVSDELAPDGPEGVVWTRRIRAGDKVAELRITARMRDKQMTFRIQCDQPWLRRISFGMPGPVMYRRHVTVPYLSVPILYLRDQSLFISAYLDWTKSRCSWIDPESATAVYQPLTDGSLRAADETICFAPSIHLAETLPGIPNPPSPHIADVGDRMVLDVWGGHFDAIREDLGKLFAAGMDRVAVIIHAWQRDGYDNGLPAHYPAMASLGGEPAMKRLVACATRQGARIMLHENYVDYYPNYEGFSDDHIALDSAGQRQLAWFNEGTQIQSFAVRPSAILPLAQTQSPEIKRRYGTNSCYLDVHSAVPPWFHVDQRAGEPDTGMHATVFAAHRDLFAYERHIYGGPVFGEGANHWYWSGLLDGVEAQYGVGYPANAGLDAPLMVDFNLLRIHPLQANHGMGYYERWYAPGEPGISASMPVLDRYRMQQIAHGHCAFLGAATWNNLPLAWLEYHLARPVAGRYAGAAVRDIRYRINGNWVDSSQAARSQEWNTVRVRYSNGLTITANRIESDIKEGRFQLRTDCWAASAPGFQAVSGWLGPHRVDVVQTPNSLFVNARNPKHWSDRQSDTAAVSITEFHSDAPRRAAITYRWTAGEPTAEPAQVFVHFVDPSGRGSEGIAFQDDHTLPEPTDSWRPGTVYTVKRLITLPDDLPDGRYQLALGLYSPQRRYGVTGHRDKTGRTVLGALVIRDGGRVISFEPETRPAPVPRALPKAVNSGGPLVDFGDIRTDGSARVYREGSRWTLQVMPGTRPVVWLSVKRWPVPEEVRLSDGRVVKPTIQKGWWRIPMEDAPSASWSR